MISAEEFCGLLDDRGFDGCVGVPCSYFAGPTALLDGRGRYVAAADEGAALALAAGRSMAGVRTGVLVQNSGFGNLINPLTSLVLPYGIGVVVFMSLRGWPDPAGDEPQHAVMGQASHTLLDDLGIRHWTLTGDADQAAVALEAAVAEAGAGRPAFVLTPKGTVGPVTSPAVAVTVGLTRTEAVGAIAAALPDAAAVVTTTGYTSRELCGLADRHGNFYMQGSMGHASAIGLGLAQSCPERLVAVIDGDGAALMHLGTMSTIASVAPANLLHILLDNCTYESTGAQRSTSPTTAFDQVAAAVGYRTRAFCHDAREVAEALTTATRTRGPHFVGIRTSVTAGFPPPRVTGALGPVELHGRFSRWLQGAA